MNLVNAEALKGMDKKLLGYLLKKLLPKIIYFSFLVFVYTGMYYSIGFERTIIVMLAMLAVLLSSALTSPVSPGDMGKNLKEAKELMGALGMMGESK